MFYRAYTLADRAACLTIFDSNVPRFFAPEDHSDFERFLDALPGFYGVLCDADGKAIACGGIDENGDGTTASLTWGMVAADRHGQGIGKELTSARLARLADMPAVRRVLLNTSQLTVGFYLKLGFRVVRHIPDGYHVGVDRYDMEASAQA
jgi:ribosomal protein S18 acetylase RimI-like enzyme